MVSRRHLERVYLLIADLSGYTAYLATSEPEHAPVIAGDFIETVVARLQGAFELAKLEGDAAFMWAPAERIDGAALLEAIDGAYFAFQRRLRSLAQASTCDCQACRRMPQLDLKFVVHLGDVLRQPIAGHEELAGRDVIVAHRLLKGTAAERAGAHSYLLLTAAAVAALGLDPDVFHMTALTERYEELGPVHAQLIDLGGRWQTEQRRRARARPAGRLIGRLERLMAASPILVWEFLTAPARRTMWEGMALVEETVGGARGVGSTAVCVSEQLRTVEEILDWRPFESFTRRVEHPDLGALTAIYQLSEVATGALLQVSWFAERPRLPDADPSASEVLLAERTAAFDRLSAVLQREDTGIA